MYIQSAIAARPSNAAVGPQRRAKRALPQKLRKVDARDGQRVHAQGFPVLLLCVEWSCIAE